jgi:acyl carrier protein
VDASSSQERMFARVVSALGKLDRRRADRRIHRDTSVVDDLGIDSLRLVELTLALEGELGIAEFPMQDWVDAEVTRTDRRFTVGSLVAACLNIAGDRAAQGEGT